MALTKEAREYFAKEGRRGGKAYVQNTTPEERKAAARRAAEARWQEHRKAMKKIATQSERSMARLDETAERISESSKALTKQNRTNTRKRKKA